MLGEEDHQDVRNLVVKADKLWALHGQKSSLVATVDQPEKEPSVVAAVSSRGRGAVAAEAVEAIEDNSLQPEVISIRLVVSLEASSLGKFLSKLPAVSRRTVEPSRH